MEATLALATAIVVMFFPVAYVWGLTIGGLRAALRETPKHGKTEAAKAMT